MNTDPCLSVLLSRKSFASCQGFSSAVLLGAHASCVQDVRHPGHAGSVRSQGRNLRVLCVSAMRFFFGCGWAALCSSVVSLFGCGSTAPWNSWPVISKNRHEFHEKDHLTVTPK